MHQANLWQQYQTSWSGWEDGNSSCYWQNAWQEGCNEYSADGAWLPAAAAGYADAFQQDSGRYGAPAHWPSSDAWLGAEAWDADAFEEIVPCAAALAAAGNLESLNSATSDDASIAPKSRSTALPSSASMASKAQSTSSSELAQKALAQKDLLEKILVDRIGTCDHELLEANPQDGSKSVAHMGQHSLRFEGTGGHEEPKEAEQAFDHNGIVSQSDFVQETYSFSSQEDALIFSQSDSVEEGPSPSQNDRTSQEETLIQKEKLEFADLPEEVPAKKTWAQLVKGGQTAKSPENVPRSHRRNVVQNPVSLSSSSSELQVGQPSALSTSSCLPAQQPDEIKSNSTLLVSVAQELWHRANNNAGSLSQLTTENPKNSSSSTPLTEQLEQSEQLLGESMHQPETPCSGTSSISVPEQPSSSGLLPEQQPAQPPLQASSGGSPSLKLTHAPEPEPLQRSSGFLLKSEASQQPTPQKKDALHSSTSGAEPLKTSHGNLPKREAAHQQSVQPSSSSSLAPIPTRSNSAQAPAMKASASSAKASKSSHPGSRLKLARVASPPSESEQQLEPRHERRSESDPQLETSEPRQEQPTAKEEVEEQPTGNEEVPGPQSKVLGQSRVTRRPMSKAAVRSTGKQAQRQKPPTSDSSKAKRATAISQKKSMLQQVQTAGLTVLRYPRCVLFVLFTLAVFAGQWSTESSDKIDPGVRAAIQGRECMHCLR